MPELPEVETVVRDLRAHGLEGAIIRRADVRWPRTVAGLTPGRFAAALVGRTIVSLSRRAKYIVVALNSGSRLLIHLRMTGKLRFAAPKDDPGKHDHVVITLEDGRRLFFNDTRKFGRFRLAGPDADPLADHVVITLEDGRRLFFNDTRKFGRFRLAGPDADPLADLGPEPLDAAFTPDVLRRQLRGKSRMLKPLLLDQATVAGLGNIYVDEALWQARLHPRRRANTLTPGETRRLHAAIVAVLQRAVDNCGTTLGTGDTNFYSVGGRRGRNADALNVFRRDGLPCPRCGTALERTVVGQRGTHLCPCCQII